MSYVRVHYRVRTGINYLCKQTDYLNCLTGPSNAGKSFFNRKRHPVSVQLSSQDRYQLVDFERRTARNFRREPLFLEPTVSKNLHFVLRDLTILPVLNAMKNRILA